MTQERYRTGHCELCGNETYMFKWRNVNVWLCVFCREKVDNHTRFVKRKYKVDDAGAFEIIKNELKKRRTIAQILSPIRKI